MDAADLASRMTLLKLSKRVTIKERLREESEKARKSEWLRCVCLSLIEGSIGFEQHCSVEVSSESFKSY